MSQFAHTFPSISLALLLLAAAAVMSALLTHRSERKRRQDLVERERRGEAARHLDESRHQQGSFIANLGHELRSPLNAVLTLSQLLLEGRTGPLTSGQRKYVEVIQSSGQNLLELISDILDLSRIENGQADIELEAVDIEALIGAAAQAMKAKATEAGVSLGLSIPTGLPAAFADPERVEQILVSLIGNAIRFGKGGHVQVSAYTDASKLSVSVSDDGPGMTEEVSQRTFRELFQTDQPLRRRHGRTGLGLTICYRLVHLMGGYIKVDTEPGRGSTFTFTLPLAAATETDAGSPPIAYPRTTTPLGVALGARILVIEDHDIDRQAVTEQLTDAGFEVVATASGQDGLDLLRSKPFDAAVLDLVMPEMNGLDVLEAARADPKCSRTPFVVLSAMYMTKTEREVLGSVAAVVRKGEEGHKELVRTLRQVLATRAEQDQHSTVLVVEDDPGAVFTLKQVLGPLRVHVETVATVEEAVRYCRQRPPDLILMDTHLRGPSGAEDPSVLRRLPHCDQVPIVGLTASESSADMERVRRAGFDDFLARPFRPLNVINTATHFLGRPAPSPGAAGRLMR